MEIIKVSPRGYCHGVVTALNKVSQCIDNDTIKKPIYILGEIVHNNNLTKAYEEQGIITLVGENRKMILDQVVHGTVIITAHGTDPNLVKEAEEKGLDIIDATCSDVYRTHDIIREKINDGFEIIYIGLKNHPEPEGAIGINPSKIHLIQNSDDIENLNLNSDKIAVTNQTTMSMWDVIKTMEALKNKFPQIEMINEICGATQERQEAVFDQAVGCDLTIVIGDPKSNNSNRLVQISEEMAKVPGFRMSNLSELNLEWLKGVKKIAITSGASTPTAITKEVIEFLEKFDWNDPSTHNTKSNIVLQNIIPRPRKK